MDRGFKTTFIPKRKVTHVEGEKKGVRKSSGNNLLFVLSLLLFFSALVSSVGVFLYHEQLLSAKKSKIVSIQRAEKAFEPEAILSLKRMDVRLRAGTEILKNHVAFSDFFHSLGESTLPDIAFQNFSLASKDGVIVHMEGEANGYLPIAQQSQLFEKNRYIQNPIFSDFELNEETGNIYFNVEFTLNPDLIRYGRTVKNITTDFSLQKEKIFLEEKEKTRGKDINFNLNNSQ